MLARCCQPEREEGTASAPAWRGTPTTAPPAVDMAPPAALVRARSDKHGRILKETSAALLARSSSAPCSLLEAARRRAALNALAAAEAAQRREAGDPSVCLAFVQAYMQAIKDANIRCARACAGGSARGAGADVRARAAAPPQLRPSPKRSWTSQQAVVDMFLPDCQIVTSDRQAFRGRDACLKRLAHGVEQLVQMAGTDAQLPTFTVSGPEPAGGAAFEVRLALHRGVSKLQLKLAFTLQGGRIASLKTTRC